MKEIAVFPNKSRDPDFTVTHRLVSVITDHGGVAVMEPELAEGFRDPNIIFKSFNSCDLLICLGGDGTFLSAAHHDSAKGLPKIGINLGSVGFLTEIEPDQIDAVVPQLINGDFEIEERSMLSIEVFDQDGNLFDQGDALNDIVLARGWGNTGIVTVDLSIDSNFVEQIPGDGIIVSTSTGSTAYNLAAGGPIVHPTVDVLLITPLAPHTLHNRTYIARDKAVVTLQLKESSGAAMFSIDGRQIVDLKPGQYALISTATEKFKKILINGDKFYQTLPNKIRLRGMTK